MKYLNPVVFFKKLFALIREITLFSKYLNIISELEKNGELSKLNLRRTRFGRLYYVKNLQPEVLLNTDDLRGFEIMQVKESLAEYNDPITRLGIIDFIKTGFRRIKTNEVYAYLVWMDFDFKEMSLERFFYVLAYPTIAAFIIIQFIAPQLGLIDWTNVWNLLNSK